MDGLREPDGRLGRGVFGFRTIADTNGMLQLAHSRDNLRACVIGGGLLGLEAAYGLRTQGVAVDVVHSPGHLMNQQLDERGGRLLRNKIEALGVGVHTARRTTSVLRDEAGHVTGVGFTDGTSLAADMIVVTAGIRPNIEFARRGGLVVERGIVVDDQMRCEDESSIYAVGECCQHRGEVYGLVAPLWEQAVVLADHLSGANPAAAYHGSRLTTKLKVAGVDVAAMGVQGPERDDDEFVQFYEPRSGIYKSVVVRDNRLIGATLLGDVSKVGFLSQAFDEKVPLPDERISTAFRSRHPRRRHRGCGTRGRCAGVQLQRRHQGRDRRDVCTRAHRVSARWSRRPAPARAAGRARPSSPRSWPVLPAVRSRPTRPPDWYVPGIPYTKPELIAAVRERGLESVSEVFAALAPDGEDATAKMPLASLLRVVWGPDWVEESGALFINDRVHANIQRDGTFSVVPQMKGGVTTPDQLRRIADVADKYAVPLVKVTGGQRIDLLGVKKEDLPKVWGDLDMPSGYAYGKSFRTVKTCVGLEFCRFGLGDSTALGIAIEERFQGLEAPAKLKLAVTGCPRNCAEALCKDLGVVAIGGGRAGRSTSAALRARTSARVTSWSPPPAATRCSPTPRGSCSTTGRTATGSNAPTRSSRGSGSSSCGACSSTTPTASAPASRSAWPPRSPATATPGSSARPRSPAQFQSSLPLLPLPQVPVR